ncbi:MAG: glycoside hydrolase family 3 N-terminal domain-containing protein [Eubacteriales bacterium]|nr:glycoside hydrolase family 3 N-terminal domain-containing protein [Eubacteriales bacterium]
MNRNEARQKAEALVEKMTVVEAASQLRYDAPAIEHLGVPAYNWWNEALHGVARGGVATSFPQAIAMAATFDRDQVQKMGDVSATEGRAKYNASTALDDRDIYKGLTFWTPNINIFRDPRWGRGHETYGEDPFLTAELGKSCIRGLQGDGETMKSAACAKHFAVHSGPEGLRHSFNVDIDRRSMEETYLPAFQAAVQEAHVEAVMGAYNAVNGAPCNGSKELLQGILRGEWGFEGHVVSDCWAINDFHEFHKVTDTPAESTAMALNAGCDLNCGCSYRCLITALMQGMVKEADIRRAAVRLFTTRYLLGIMGEGSEYDSIPFEAVECPAHLAAAREAAQRSCVLLDNKGILPLDKTRLKTVGVIGPNANSREALVGNYHGTSSRYITVLEGIQDELGEDVRVLYAQGCHLFKDTTEPLAQAGDRISEAVQVANHSDVTVLVLGLDATLEGEQGDTGNADASGDKLGLLLPECQRKLADAVLATGKPVILCLMAGSAIDVSEISDRAAATVLLWYPGARGGRTAADILFGNVSPSGKLPVTFYHNGDLEKMPAFTDYSMENRTYKFMDFAPLYPFGYGLTYGDVNVLSAQRREEADRVIITAQVENRAARATEDVLQVYVQNEGSPLAPRNPRLCGFQRFACAPGEQKTVEISVPAAQLRVVDETGSRISDGTPVFYVGLGQPDARTEELTGKKSIKL